MTGNKVFQNGKAFAEVGLDGHFNGFPGRVGHQATHPGQLADLLVIPAGAGSGHHVDRVKGIQVGQQGFPDGVGGPGPNTDDQLIPFVIGNQAAAELGFNAVDFFIRLIQQEGFFVRDNNIRIADGNTGLGGVFIALTFNPVQHLGRLTGPQAAEAAVNDVAQLLFPDHFVDIADFIRNRLVENQATNAGVDHPAIRHAHFNQRLNVDATGIIGQFCFGGIGKPLAGTEGVGPDNGQVVAPQHHVLGGDRHRTTVFGV